MLFFVVLLYISYANAKLIYERSEMEQDTRINMTNLHEMKTVKQEKMQLELNAYAQERFQSLYFYLMIDKSVAHRRRNQLIMECIREWYPRVPQEAQREMVEVIMLMELFAKHLRPNLR